jgi:hypothetical protein
MLNFVVDLHERSSNLARHRFAHLKPRRHHTEAHAGAAGLRATLRKHARVPPVLFKDCLSQQPNAEGK